MFINERFEPLLAESKRNLLYPSISCYHQLRNNLFLRACRSCHASS